MNTSFGRKAWGFVHLPVYEYVWKDSLSQLWFAIRSFKDEQLSWTLQKKSLIIICLDLYFFLSMEEYIFFLSFFLNFNINDIFLFWFPSKIADLDGCILHPLKPICQGFMLRLTEVSRFQLSTIHFPRSTNKIEIRIPGIRVHTSCWDYRHLDLCLHKKPSNLELTLQEWRRKKKKKNKEGFWDRQGNDCTLPTSILLPLIDLYYCYCFSRGRKGVWPTWRLRFKHRFRELIMWSLNIQWWVHFHIFHRDGNCCGCLERDSPFLERN